MIAKRGWLCNKYRIGHEVPLEAEVKGNSTADQTLTVRLRVAGAYGLGMTMTAVLGGALAFAALDG